MLETSAFQSLYGGQFTLSTPLINQIFVFHSPTDAAPQFLQKLTPLRTKCGCVRSSVSIPLLWVSEVPSRHAFVRCRRLAARFHEMCNMREMRAQASGMQGSIPDILYANCSNSCTRTLLYCSQILKLLSIVT